MIYDQFRRWVGQVNRHPETDAALGLRPTALVVKSGGTRGAIPGTTIPIAVLGTAPATSEGPLTTRVAIHRGEPRMAGSTILAARWKRRGWGASKFPGLLRSRANLSENYQKIGVSSASCGVKNA